MALWICHADMAPFICKRGTNLADKRRMLGQYSLLVGSGHGVCFSFSQLWTTISCKHDVLSCVTSLEIGHILGVYAMETTEVRGLKYIYTQLQTAYYPRRSNYHSSPMCESHVVIILKSPAYSSITDALLPLLQFFKQAEVTWNNCNGAVLLQHTINHTFCNNYLATNIHTGRRWIRMGSMCNMSKYIQLGSRVQSGFLGHNFSVIKTLGMWTETY
jgi:hypothetical protein